MAKKQRSNHQAGGDMPPAASHEDTAAKTVQSDDAVPIPPLDGTVPGGDSEPQPSPNDEADAESNDTDGQIDDDDGELDDEEDPGEGDAGGGEKITAKPAAPNPDAPETTPKVAREPQEPAFKKLRAERDASRQVFIIKDRGRLYRLLGGARCKTATRAQLTRLRVNVEKALAEGLIEEAPKPTKQV